MSRRVQVILRHETLGVIADVITYDSKRTINMWKLRYGRKFKHCTTEVITLHHKNLILRLSDGKTYQTADEAAEDNECSVTTIRVHCAGRTSKKFRYIKEGATFLMYS